MPEWDLVPKDKAHFQSIRYKDQVRTLTFDNTGRKPRTRAKDPQVQAPKPKVGHSAPNLPQHCPQDTFFKIDFLQLTFFHSLIGTEVSTSCYWHLIPGTMLSTQLRWKGNRLGEKAISPSQRRGSLWGGFPGHICIPLLLLLSQEPSQTSLINQSEMTRWWKNLSCPIPQPNPNLIMDGLPAASCLSETDIIEGGRTPGPGRGEQTPPYGLYWLTFVHT